MSYFGHSLRIIVIFLLNSQITPTSADRWDGLTQQTTIFGEACLTPCEKRDKEDYWCHTAWTEYDSYWALCSPNPGQDVFGKPCMNECSPKVKIGSHISSSSSTQREYHCKANETNYASCGPTLSSPTPTHVTQYQTRKGKWCVSPCEKQGYSYNWCYTYDMYNRDWEYCSAKPTYDINGNKCAGDCKTRGYSYFWCTLAKGGWNYCSNMIVSSRTEFTYIGSKCVSPCEMSWEDSIFTNSNTNICYDAKRVARPCSRVAGLAANNKKCFSPCNKRTTNQSLKFAENSCWTTNLLAHDPLNYASYCSNVQDVFQDESESGTATSWIAEYVSKELIDVNLLQTKDRTNVFLVEFDFGEQEIIFFENIGTSGESEFYSLNVENLNWYYEMAATSLRLWKRNSTRLVSGRNSGTLEQAGDVDSGENDGVQLYQNRRYVDKRTRMPYVELQLQVNGVDPAENDGSRQSLQKFLLQKR